MKQEMFVSYGIALKLKDLGFNAPCLTCYGINKILKNIWNADYDEDEITENFNTTHIDLYSINGCNINEKYVAAPLYSEVIDWFLEKHNINIIAWKDIHNKLYYPIICNIKTGKIIDTKFFKEYHSDNYYKALEKGIEEAFKQI